MTDQHPITPPPELQEQWKQEWLDVRPSLTTYDEWMLAKSARWGYEQRAANNEDELQKARDEELDACCEHLKRSMSPRATIDFLRAARRPKPPSLKERALNALSHLIDGAAYSMDTTEPAEYIRRALEALPDD